MKPSWHQNRIWKRSHGKIAWKLKSTVFPIEFNDFSTFKDQFSEPFSGINPLRNNIKDGMPMFNHHLAWKSSTRCPQDAPRRSQDGHKTGQEGPKTPQDACKRPPRPPKTLSGRLQDAPRCAQDAPYTPHESHRTTQVTPRRPQNAPRRPQDASRPRFWCLGTWILEVFGTARRHPGPPGTDLTYSWPGPAECAKRLNNWKKQIGKNCPEHAKNIPKPSLNHPKIIPEFSQNHPQTILKSS